MATLDAFGFAKGSRRSQLEQPLKTCAFICPSNAIAKKPMLMSAKTFQKKPTLNTLTHYFTQKPQLTDEEECVRCIIRQRIPMLQLWDKIQEEHEKDIYMQMRPEKPVVGFNKKRRYNHAAVPTLKRQKTDIELAEVMAQFLNLSNKIKYHAPQLQDTFIKDYQQEEDECLSRQLRYKMDIQHSNLFLHQITQEFLLS